MRALSDLRVVKYTPSRLEMVFDPRLMVMEHHIRLRRLSATDYQVSIGQGWIDLKARGKLKIIITEEG